MDPAYGPPYSAVDVLLLPGLCLVFTLLFRFLAWSLDKNNRDGRKMKILAWVPLVVAMYLGVRYAWWMYDPENGMIYRKMMESMMKVKLAHWISIVLPVVLLGAMLIWDRTERKLGRPIAI